MEWYVGMSSRFAIVGFSFFLLFLVSSFYFFLTTDREVAAIQNQEGKKLELIDDLYDLDGKKISTMSLKEAKRVLKDKKNIKGGMYPKLTGAIDCLEKGVKNAHIVDGRVPHSILIELLTDKGVGTWISK